MGRKGVGMLGVSLWEFSQRGKGKSGVLFCWAAVLFLGAVILSGCLPDPNGLPQEPAESGESSAEDTFAQSTGSIHDYLPKLLAGESVTAYELLPCLENFTQAIWSQLDKEYKGDWWGPLWLALNDFAIGDGSDPMEYDEQILRNYYLGKAFLAADGVYSEGLMNILLRQWSHDKALYSTTLGELFSEEEEDTLRRFLTYSINSWTDDLFGLHIPDTGIGGGSLYLGAYPVDFPFQFSLTEDERETFTAESFGPVNIVKSGDLQVTFLNPYEGVYRVITLRSLRKGDSVKGIAVGGREEGLLKAWENCDLKKINSVSGDDEVWFGNQYDYAYSYTRGEATKSILYLIKDGKVQGIELIDGLDGAMY